MKLVLIALVVVLLSACSRDAVNQVSPPAKTGGQTQTPAPAASSASPGLDTQVDEEEEKREAEEKASEAHKKALASALKALKDFERKEIDTAALAEGINASVEEGLKISDPEVVDKYLEAAWDGETDVIRVFLDAGMPVDATLVTRPGRDGVLGGALVALDNLLGTGTPGRTALMSASQMARLETVNLLLERGANPNARDKAGSVSLMYLHTVTHSSAEDALKVWQNLIAAGADVKARDEAVNTLLHRSMGQWYAPHFIKSYLEMGVDKNARNKSGETAEGVLLRKMAQYEERYGKDRTYRLGENLLAILRGEN